MKPIRTLSTLLYITILALSACGRGTPVPTSALPSDSPESSTTPPPAATSTPAATETQAPTLDPNAVVPGGTVVVGIPREPDVLSPIMANENLERVISWLFVEGLVQIDAKGDPIPVLAETLPTLSEDGMVLTYTLKKGIRFSNGDPFTCADVQFTWKAVMSYLAPISKSGYERIKSVDCPDETTAVVNFSSGYLRYLQLFSFVLPKGAGSLDTINKWEYHQAPISTGPWKVLEWQVGDHILLARNEYYREPGKPYLDNIMLKFLQSQNSLDLLTKRELDVTWGLDESYLVFLKDLASQGISYSTAQSGINELLIFNLADPKIDAPLDAATNPHPILSDVRVRQAFQYAIDKQTLVDNLLPGSVNTSSSILPPSQFNCPFAPSEYNPEKGKALLEEAGWKTGTDGIREKDGVRLSLKITTEAENGLRIQIEQAIARDLKAIGVELIIEKIPSKELNGNWKSGGLGKHGHFDILLLAIGPGINPAGGMKRDFHSKRIPTVYNQGEGNNYARYHNTDVDTWIDQALSSTSSEQQQELLCKIAEQVNQDVPVIPIYEHLIVSAHQARLQNFIISPGPANFTFNSQDWWLRP